MGSAKKVAVSAANNPLPQYSGGTGGTWPEATFTFSGTGFDVISALSNSTGVVQVDVYEGQDAAATDKLVKSALVDSYYGYTYKDGKWETSDNEDALYQVPLIKMNLGKYSTYTVKLTPKYSKAFDHGNKGSYDFILDAIRIYDPIDPSAETANQAIYVELGREKALFHSALRPLILDAGKTFEGNKDDLLGSAWFIDGSESGGTWDDFEKYGPKNEVYLGAGQAITFGIKLNGIQPSDISSIKVSMHILKGSETNVAYGTTSEASAPVNVKSNTILYYDIPEQFFKSDDSSLWGADNTLTKPLVITNSGNEVLSLCDIMICTKDYGVNGGSITFNMQKSDIAGAERIVSLISDRDMSKGFFLPEKMEVSPESAKVLRNTDSSLIIKTSDDADKVLVDGKNALLKEKRDGVKIWSYDFTAGAKRGVKTFSATAYSKAGNPSDPVKADVKVQSYFENILDKIIDFLNKAISALNYLV